MPAPDYGSQWTHRPKPSGLPCGCSLRDGETLHVDTEDSLGAYKCGFQEFVTAPPRALNVPPKFYAVWTEDASSHWSDPEPIDTGDPYQVIGEDTDASIVYTVPERTREDGDDACAVGTPVYSGTSTLYYYGGGSDSFTLNPGGAWVVVGGGPGHGSLPFVYGGFTSPGDPSGGDEGAGDSSTERDSSAEVILTKPGPPPGWPPFPAWMSGNDYFVGDQVTFITPAAYVALNDMTPSTVEPPSDPDNWGTVPPPSEHDDDAGETTNIVVLSDEVLTSELPVPDPMTDDVAANLGITSWPLVYGSSFGVRRTIYYNSGPGHAEAGTYVASNILDADEFSRCSDKSSYKVKVLIPRQRDIDGDSEWEMRWVELFVPDWDTADKRVNPLSPGEPSLSATAKSETILPDIITTWFAGMYSRDDQVEWENNIYVLVVDTLDSTVNPTNPAQSDNWFNLGDNQYIESMVYDAAVPMSFGTLLVTGPQVNPHTTITIEAQSGSMITKRGSWEPRELNRPPKFWVSVEASGEFAGIPELGMPARSYSGRYLINKTTGAVTNTFSPDVAFWGGVRVNGLETDQLIPFDAPITVERVASQSDILSDENEHQTTE